MDLSHKTALPIDDDLKPLGVGRCGAHADFSEGMAVLCERRKPGYDKSGVFSC
jgi:hypothetical protein